MKYTKYTFLVLTCVLIWNSAIAQQDPIYAQYLNNPLPLNPAYTGSNKTWQSIAGIRSQWAGLDGSPTTFNFSTHTALVNNKVGAGFTAIQDRIGEVKNTEFGFTYSYRITKKENDFYFGLSTGMVRYSTDPGMLHIQSTDDAAFAPINRFQFNTGFGVMLKGTKYLVGFSVPKLIPSSIRHANGDIQVYNRHFYVTGTYLHYIGTRMQLKPSVLLRGVPGAPLSADISGSIILNEQILAGLLTRNFSSYGLLLQMWIKRDLRVGYVFEVPTGRSVGANYTTHEVTIAWSKAVLKSHEKSFSHF